MEPWQKKLQNHRRGIDDEHWYARSSVLLPLVHSPIRGWEVLFEVRSNRLRAQPGEICFPGGRVDINDRDESQTAVRETCEELGITVIDIDVWGPLDVVVTPFRQILYPFAGLIKCPERIRPNLHEVEEVFTVSLPALLSATPDYYEIPIRIEPPDSFPFDRIPGGRNYPWRQGFLPEFFYEFEGRVVWGLTARILHTFLRVIR